MARYYAQRAGAGLIISEATGISREGLGWPSAPGLWNDEQVEGWKLVTDAVHAEGRPDRRATVAHGTAGPPGSRWRPAGLLLGHHRPRPRPHLRGQQALCRGPRRDPGRHRPDRRGLCPRRRNAIAPGSTASRSMAPMAIWSTSSCATPPICATTTMAGRSTTVFASLREVLEAVGDAIGMEQGHPLLAQHSRPGRRGQRSHPALCRAGEALEESNVPWIELREPHKPTSSGSVPTAPVSPAMRNHYSGKIVINSDHDWTDARQCGSRAAMPTRSASAGCSSPTPTW